MSVDAYGYWRACLKNGGKAPDGVAFLPTYHGNSGHEEPQPGLYRTRIAKGGPLVPVQIWLTKDGATTHTFVAGCELAGTINGKSVTADTLADRWIWLEPITKTALAFYTENGRWEGEAPTIGDNSGNLTPLELLRDYIETARSWFKGKKFDTQNAVDEAANYTAELTKRKNDADRERDGLIRPHLDAQRDINAKYKPQIEDADTLVKNIKRSCDDFMRAEKARLEAEQRAKYAAELKAAEEARKAVEEQRAKQMRDDPIAAMTTAEPELPMAPPPPEPVKVQAGGQRGKKMALRTYTVHEITDYAAALAWAKDDPKVIDAVTAVCVAASRAGWTVPGVTTRQEERAA